MEHWEGRVDLGQSNVPAHADMVRGHWFVTVVLPFSGRYVKFCQQRRIAADLAQQLSPIQEVRFVGREGRRYATRKP